MSTTVDGLNAPHSGSGDSFPAKDDQAVKRSLAGPLSASMCLREAYLLLLALVSTSQHIYFLTISENHGIPSVFSPPYMHGVICQARA
jgi:hypothetical protein